MDIENQLKLAVISGASHALSYKQEHPRASDEDAIQYVTKEVKQILKNLDKVE